MGVRPLHLPPFLATVRILPALTPRITPHRHKSTPRSGVPVSLSLPKNRIVDTMLVDMKMEETMLVDTKVGTMLVDTKIQALQQSSQQSVRDLQIESMQ